MRTTARLNASWYQRRYERRTHLDGPITDLSAGVGWVASPTMRIEATLGWGRERTELERERNSRRWMRLGATFALPLGFTVGASGTLRWTDYQGDWLFYTPGGSSRRDLTRNFGLDVYNRAFTVAGFSPQVSVVREDRTSTAQLYDYERTFGELRFVRQF